MADIQRVLPDFFQRIRYVCSDEHTYQIVLADAILNSGIASEAIENEHRIGTGSVDLFIHKSGGQKSDCAIEVKGGAHRGRNCFKAHPEAFKTDDLPKLNTLHQKGVETWWVGVETSKLPGKLSVSQLDGMRSVLCGAGHSMAFFRQDENFFYLGKPRSTSLTKVPLPILPVNDGKPKGSFPSAIKKSLNAQSNFRNERNPQRDLYAECLRSGWADSSVAADLFLGFSRDFVLPGDKEGSKKQPKRYDLAVFSQGICGNFNLYLNGNQQQSLDVLKAKHILGLAEIKIAFSEVTALRDFEKLRRAKNQLIQLGACSTLEAWFILINKEDKNKWLDKLREIRRNYNEIHVAYTSPSIGVQVL